MSTAFEAHLLTGTHAARPAATAVPSGTLYSCSDHGLVYQSDGAVWSTWATLGATAVGNLWKMSKTTSQTLTNGGTDIITFDSADIDGGGAVIDLANERFVAPATGLYMAFATWLWEAIPPGPAANMSARVGGVDVATIVRGPIKGDEGSGGYAGNWPLSLTSGDFVTLVISPSVVTGVTARGNAAIQIRTSFTLVRIT